MPSYNQLLVQAQQLLTRGKIADAEPLFKQVLELRSRNVDSLVGLGLIYNATHRNAEAADLFQKALAIQPYSLLATANLGAAYHALDRHDDAIACFKQYLTFQPDTPTILYNLGTSLKAAGQLPDAVAALRRAVELKPDYAEAWFNLGNTLREQQKFDDSIDAYQHALTLKPAYAEACSNIGLSYKDKGNLDEAVTWFRKAMTLKPSFTDPVTALASALRDLGQVEDSLIPFRHHLQQKPTDQLTHSGYLLALEYLPGQNPQTIFDEHLRWAKQHADPASFPEPAFSNDRSPDRRLRIGYLSADFRQHAVSFFLENLLAFHDPAQVEIFCYNTNTYTDAVTERFKKYAHHWRDIARLSEENLAEQIHSDQIDILADLAGHSGGNRLLALARRPAPVQISFLGYIDTTGLSQVDYRFVDEHTDPPGMTESLHSEQLVRLPSTFAAFRPFDASPPVSPPPAIANGHITFGALAVAAKVNTPLLKTWASLLSRLPNSRLILGGNGLLNASVQQRITAIFSAAGIAPDRLEFFGSQPLPDYYALHARLDILLDPFPIAGHTITCNALWMGVPVISLAGKKYVSRLGVSVLTNLNLTGLLADTPEQYIDIAVRLATDLPRLAELRAAMRDRMKASPLMNYPAYAKNVEDAYRTMWHKWCNR